MTTSPSALIRRITDRVKHTPQRLYADRELTVSITDTETDAETGTSHPFRASFDIYHRAGWSPLPLKPRLKVAPPEQFTGYDDDTGDLNPYPSYADLYAWAELERYARGNVCLRMPPTVVGLDVDVYGTKRGDLALATLIADIGPLPATWRSTSRGTNASAGTGLHPSGHLFFRVPAGTRFKGEAAKGIELLQAGHRYAVVWPSLNPDNNLEVYRWYRPDGSLAEPGEVPNVDDLPELPAAWLSYLTATGDRVTKASMLASEVADWLEGLRRGPACGRAISELEKLARDLKAGGSAHEVMLRGTRALVKLAAEGHRLGSASLEKHGKGAPVDQLYRLHRLFVDDVTAPGRNGRRDPDQAREEWDKALTGAVKLARAQHPLGPELQDPDCISFDDLPDFVGRVDVPGSVGVPDDQVAAHDWTRDPGATAAAAVDRREREPLNVSNPSIVAEWLLQALGRGALSGLFTRGDASVIVHTPAIGEGGYKPPADAHDDDGPAQVRPIVPQELAAKIQFLWACYREKVVTANKEGYYPKDAVELTDGTRVVRSPAMFPLEAAQRVLAASYMIPNARRIVGVVHIPTIREDGSLMANPGYDHPSRLLYLPEPGLTIPAVRDSPLGDEVAKARDLLLHMVSDFRFVTPHDLAAYFGLLLTPVLRLIAPGPYKMFAISAHQAGSGKTLLANIARTIHGGVFRAEMPEDDAELRKSITAILSMTTGAIVHIDNVTGVVRSSTLAGLLTSDKWDDRRLGENELARCVNDRLWVLTGNNMALGGDLVRRTIAVNIDPGVPNPHLRTGFAIPDLEGWVRENRADLLAALITLTRAWVAAGKPGAKVSSDSYGNWLAAVNGVLGVAGISGTCDAPEARGDAEGEEDAEWATLLEAIEDTFGLGTKWTVKELLAKVNPGQGVGDGFEDVGRPIDLDKLPEALVIKMRQARAEPASLAKSLGRWFGNRKGRWARNLTVREVSRSKDKVTWRIERYTTKPDFTQDQLLPS